MEEIEGKAQETAVGILETMNADAAAFPLFMVIIAWLIAMVIMWSVVEMIKAIYIAGLPRKPPKDAGEKTIVGKIAKKHKYYPLLIWGVSLFGGALVGFGIGAIDGFGEGDLGWWGIVSGAAAGVTNGFGMRWLRGFGDKMSDLAFGWIKRRLGAKDEE